MNDYDPLRDYLKKQHLPEFVLSFEQIEEIIDAALPRAAHRASWWETLRSPQEIAGFFDSLQLEEPGVVSITRWRPEPIPSSPPAELHGFCGVARKP